MRIVGADQQFLLPQGRFVIVPDAFYGAGQLAVVRLLNLGDLRVDLLNFLVFRSVSDSEHRAVAFERLQLRLVAPQRRIVQHFGQRFGRVMLGQLVASLPRYPFILNFGEFTLELRQFRIVERGVLSREYVAGSLHEIARLLFCFLNARFGFFNLGGQPFAGLLRGLDAGMGGVVDKLLRHGVQEFRGHFRAGGFAAEFDQTGAGDRPRFKCTHCHQQTGPGSLQRILRDRMDALAQTGKDVSAGGRKRHRFRLHPLSAAP